MKIFSHLGRMGLWACIVVLATSCSTTATRYSSSHRNKSESSNATLSEAYCRPVPPKVREEILRLADPENFPNSRYVKRWNDRKPIEQETDCSKFVHEIYRRAGLSYPRATTRALSELQSFVEVPADEARPGDLVIFPKHVGILTKDGQVISATQRGGRRGLATKSNRDRRFRSSIVKTPKEQFSPRWTYLQYRCLPPDES